MLRVQNVGGAGGTDVGSKPVRLGREDGLLPSHILDTALLPASVTLEDRAHFAVLRDAAQEIVHH